MSAQQQKAAKRVTKQARPGSTEAISAAVREALGPAWLPLLYRERILPLRTRAHSLPVAASKNARIEVQHTLLGVELKVGRRRMSCPDFSTARYLAVFARMGCADVAVPYDITRISQLADELESAWQRTLLLADHLSEGRPTAFRSRVRKAVLKEIRQEIEEAGAGTPVPQFNQNTKQRQQRV